MFVIARVREFFSPLTCEVVAQQEAEIMEKKKQSELLLRAQFAEAMKAHEQALTLQGQRAQALVDKEQQLVTMQQQLQKQFEEKQAQINMGKMEIDWKW